jgi:hypothetical protein
VGNSFIPDIYYPKVFRGLHQSLQTNAGLALSLLSMQFPMNYPVFSQYSCGLCTERSGFDS